MPSKYKVIQLYPEALNSLSVASYDWQSYGGGIRIRIQIGLLSAGLRFSLYGVGADAQETPFPSLFQ
jgi:hypothetical protein